MRAAPKGDDGRMFEQEQCIGRSAGLDCKSAFGLQPHRLRVGRQARQSDDFDFSFHGPFKLKGGLDQVRRLKGAKA